MIQEKSAAESPSPWMISYIAFGGAVFGIASIAIQPTTTTNTAFLIGVVATSIVSAAVDIWPKGDER